MTLIPEEKQIYVSGRIWHELYPKVDPYPFLYVLNQQIDLSKYGDGISKYHFTFIAATPDDKLNLPGTHHSRKRKAVEIAVNLPYERVVSSSKPEVIKLMEAAYLEGIDLIGTIKLPSNFDVAAFKHDVKAIFADEGWYLQALEQ